MSLPLLARFWSILNRYFGGSFLLRKSSIHFSWSSTVRGSADRPSAESIITERGDGVSPPQLRFIFCRNLRFHADGKSACPTELSIGTVVMKYLVRFMGSSRPAPQFGTPGRFIHANCCSRPRMAFLVMGMIRKR